MKSKVFVVAADWLDAQLKAWLSEEKPSTIISMSQSSNGSSVVLTILYN